METGHQFLSDSEVIGQLLNSKTAQEGIKYLYRTHFESLSWYVLHHGGSEQDAQDVFQEVIVAFVHLVQLQKFRGESTIKTFLFSMNRNIWFNELKKRGRAHERGKKYSEMSQPDERIEGVIEQREASRQLMEIMDVLGENCKKILVLFYYENYSMKELLKELNYENEQVVRNKKYKCLKQLEEMIQSEKGLYQQLKNILHG